MTQSLHTKKTPSNRLSRNDSGMGAFSYRTHKTAKNRRDLKVINQQNKTLRKTYQLVGFTPLYYRGLSNLLTSEFPDLSTDALWEFDSTFNLKSNHWDLIIIDLGITESTQLRIIKERLDFFESLLDQAKEASPILVVSENIFPLARYKAKLLSSGNGFGVISKSTPFKQLKQMLNLIQEGVLIWPQEIRDSPISESLSPTLERLLELKFISGLSDLAIANQLDISSRTVRSYWVQLQQAFGIEKDPELDLSIQIMNAAQKYGFLSWE